MEGSGILPEPISRPLLSFVNSFLFRQASNNQAFSILLSSAPISLVTTLFEPCNHCTIVVLLLPSALLLL